MTGRIVMPTRHANSGSEHDSRCDCRPWCDFCGGLMVDDRTVLVCVGCGAEFPVDEPAEVRS